MSRTFAPLSLVALFTAGSAWGQSAPAQPMPSTATVVPVEPQERVNSINGSPLGVVVGNYSLNYERLLAGAHGLMVEGNFSMSKDGGSKSMLYGGGVGYRWHWSSRQSSGFLGLLAGYSVGTGEASVNDMKLFDLKISAPWVVANIGKRWAWDNGLNITFRIGGGYAKYNVSSDSSDPDAQQAVDLLQDLLNFLPIALDGELSVGYNF